MALQSLGYVAIGSAALDDWTDFSTNLLGMQVTESATRTIALRMDDRRQRLIIDADADVPRSFGWEVADAAALNAVAERVEAAGIAVKAMSHRLGLIDARLRGPDQFFLTRPATGWSFFTARHARTSRSGQGARFPGFVLAPWASVTPC